MRNPITRNTVRDDSAELVNAATFAEGRHYLRMNGREVFKFSTRIFLVKVHKYANTSAASIPVAICDGLESREIDLEDRLLLVSFGTGLTWASAVLQMAPTTEVTFGAARTALPEVAELVSA